jgi:hypothetical protein
VKKIKKLIFGIYFRNLWIFLSGFIAYGLSLAGLTIPVYAELVKSAQ